MATGPTICIHEIHIVHSNSPPAIGVHSQHVTDNAHTPHVRVQPDPVEVDHLRCHKLGGAEQHLQRFAGIVAARHAKVNQLDAIAALGQTEHVLWLQVQVDDVAAVYEGDALADLAHEDAARLLAEEVLVLGDALEQFAADDSGRGGGYKIQILNTYMHAWARATLTVPACR